MEILIVQELVNKDILHGISLEVYGLLLMEPSEQFEIKQFEIISELNLRKYGVRERKLQTQPKITTSSSSTEKK